MSRAESAFRRGLLAVAIALSLPTAARGQPAEPAPPPAEPAPPPAEPAPPPTAPTPPPAEGEPVDLGIDEEESEAFQDQIHVYQQRPFMRRLRVEIAPEFGVAVNDPLTWHITAGGVLAFHITNEWSIGASYHKFFHDTSSTFDEVEEEFGVFPEKKFRDFYAGGHVAWVPVYGKFILFESTVAHFDAYVLAGAGVMRTFRPGEEGANRVSWNIGAGARVALTEWLTMHLEIRDYMYIEELRTGDTFVNNVMLHTGLSVFIPFSYDYQYAK